MVVLIKLVNVPACAPVSWNSFCPGSWCAWLLKGLLLWNLNLYALPLWWVPVDLTSLWHLCIFITAMYIYNSVIYNSLTWFSDSNNINLFYNTKQKIMIQHLHSCICSTYVIIMCVIAVCMVVVFKHTYPLKQLLILLCHIKCMCELHCCLSLGLCRCYHWWSVQSNWSGGWCLYCHRYCHGTLEANEIRLYILHLFKFMFLHTYCNLECMSLWWESIWYKHKVVCT